MGSAKTSKVLMDLEQKKSTSSSLESTLFVCKKDSSTQTLKPRSGDGKLVTTSAPTSQVLGKVKDFLGVMAEANKRLQHESKENSKDYDIEVLSGKETEYIEMDLVLGVADLHTPEAVAAAESAMAGLQPVVPLVATRSGSDDDDDDADDDDDDDDDDDEDDGGAAAADNKTCTSHKYQESNSDNSNGQPKKRPKIIELL